MRRHAAEGRSTLTRRSMLLYECVHRHHLLCRLRLHHALDAVMPKAFWAEKPCALSHTTVPAAAREGRQDAATTAHRYGGTQVELSRRRLGLG